MSRLVIADKPKPKPAAAAPAAAEGSTVTAEDREQAAALKRKGDEAFVAGQYEAAAEHYSGAIQRFPDDHILNANRSAARLKLGQLQGALDDARRARTIKPDYTKAWFREGSAAAVLKQWEDAACAFFEAHSLEPANKQIEQAFKDAIEDGRKEHLAKQGNAPAGAAP